MQSFISYVIVIILNYLVIFKLCVSMLAKIEYIKLSSSVSLAPVSGVTDVPFRKKIKLELGFFQEY